VDKTVRMKKADAATTMLGPAGVSHYREL